MTFVEFISTAWRNAVETASYLVAYAFALPVAVLVHLTLVALARARDETSARKGVAASFAAAVTSPLCRRSIESALRAAASPAAAVTFLAISHAWTAHYWILLGPLLGKDFLVSHAIGVSSFGILAALLARRMGVVAPGPASATPAPHRLPVLLGLTAWRNVLLIAIGLALGGAIAAWGLSPWTWAPADIGAGGFWTQLVSCAIGLALALSGMPPISNLFIGTYLWKTGLAHAGIVTFFCAAPASPTRWKLYERTFGRSGAMRLVSALVVAAILAGLGTAWLFGRTGIEIRYKLIPAQLWESH